MQPTLKHKRVDELRKRKNFLPSIVITLVLWLILTGIIYFASPDNALTILLFFALLFINLLFTFSLILANRRRGFWVALSITIFLGLRYFGVGSPINLVLLIAIATTFEIYFSRRA